MTVEIRTDGWTGGQKGRKADKSNFTRRCPTNVEHPINSFYFHG